MTQVETKELFVGCEVIFDGQHAFVSNLMGERALIMVGQFNEFKLVNSSELTFY